jgi:hypothetical protein
MGRRTTKDIFLHTSYFELHSNTSVSACPRQFAKNGGGELGFPPPLPLIFDCRAYAAF